MTDKTGTTKDEAAARGAGDESAQPAGRAEVERAEVEIDKMSVTEIHKKLEEALAGLEEKQKALEEKEREAAEYKDKYLRALAESENARKRIRQQAEESARIQREGLLRDLLSIIDNLERAVAAARGGGNGKPIVDFLRGHGVTQLSAVGQPFDPLLHEAVDHVESAQHEPNTVVDEFVRGYYIGDRLLRPARVTVSKLPPPSGERGSGAGGGGHVENQ